MDGRTNLTSAFGKYVLSLFASLLVATLVVFPLDGGLEPGSLPRLVWVVTFFTVFTLLFLWDVGYLRR
jgi:hypothetical protein